MPAGGLHVLKFVFVIEKCLFCPERMECVGRDVSTDGNRPVQSKHSLLKTSPSFKVARDIHSFLGFLNFYRVIIFRILSNALNPSGI